MKTDRMFRLDLVVVDGGDLGWCEVCEEEPATQRAKHVEARICASCAEGEPDLSAI